MAAVLSRPRAHALLHFTVLLWGLTAILGKSITLSAAAVVWYRTAIVVAVVFVVRALRGDSFRLPAARALRLAGIGVLVAIHWLLFYGCIKVSGVAVAVLCLSTLALFTAVVEPLLFRRRFRVYEVLFGGIAVIGVLLLLKLERLGSPQGLAMGIGSALFSAAFGTMNGKLVKSEDPQMITLVELASACAATSLVFLWDPTLFVAPWNVSAADLVKLLTLAILCTVLPWMWSLRVLTVLAPYAVSLAVTLEPVYSMVIARAVWPESENFSLRFYVGAAALLALNPLNMWMSRRLTR